MLLYFSRFALYAVRSNLMKTTQRPQKCNKTTNTMTSTTAAAFCSVPSRKLGTRLTVVVVVKVAKKKYKNRKCRLIFKKSSLKITSAQLNFSGPWENISILLWLRQLNLTLPDHFSIPCPKPAKGSLTQPLRGQSYPSPNLINLFFN